MRRIALTALSLALTQACALDRGGLLEPTPGGMGGGGTPGGATSGSSSSQGPVGPGGGSVGPGGGSAGGRGGAGGEGGSPPSCPGGPGPSMLYVVHPQGDFCIDRTEVTSAQYKLFVDAALDATQMPSPCDFKTTFVPRAAGQNCEPKHYDPLNLPNRPVACVDWCDATAYCDWAGKRLCGRAGGGANDFDDYARADRSEWYYACSANDTSTYPYGNAYDPSACVGDEHDSVPNDGWQDDAVDVGSIATCEGGLPGLFDMSGNVWEWERSCNQATGSADVCRTRGGSFWDMPTSYLACDQPGPGNHTRGYYNKNIGFRCCADPLP